MRLRLPKSPWAIAACIVLASFVLAVPAGSIYYVAAGGRACARCHEIRGAYHDWTASSHKDVSCSKCHGGLFTPDLSFHLHNLRMVVKHFRGEAPEAIQLRAETIPAMMARCAGCHKEEHDAWRQGPHSVTYKKLFLNEDHNKSRALSDNCLRCHGMYFNGPIRDLVEPLDMTGPWRLKEDALLDQPAIPCLACHQMHRDAGEIAERAKQENPREKTVASTSIYDRRSRLHYHALDLPIPAMKDNGAAVKMASEKNQAVCYQCHSPEPAFAVNSGDDRTCVGVHEGIACNKCHVAHSMETKTTCKDCHPRDSNCGLDVETMDTTFRSPDSAHNIHFVKCADCHKNGVPEKKVKVEM